jgi:WD40 repeat protein
MPKTTIELDGRTIGDFSGDLKITALATEKDNLAIGLNDGTIRWWHSTGGNWSLKTGHFVPDRQEVLTAINAKLKLGKLFLSTEEYKKLVGMKQELEAGQPLKISFIEFGHNEFSPVYSLSFTCQSHRFTADCWTDGTNLHLGRLFIQR